jgi:phage antirepressor YoqD-like protein
MSDLISVTTHLERVETIAKAMQYLREDADRLREQLALVQPKVESFDALMRSERTMSITTAAKHFGLSPRALVFPYLRDRGYLTHDDLPTQDAIDAGYLTLRETKCPHGEVRPQAVVLTSQLETWRTRVVPQIRRWECEA